MRDLRFLPIALVLTFAPSVATADVPPDPPKKEKKKKKAEAEMNAKKDEEKKDEGGCSIGSRRSVSISAG